MGVESVSEEGQNCILGGGGGGWFWGGGGGGTRGGVPEGGGGGGCVHQNTACPSEVPGGCAKPTDLSNY